VAAAAAAAGAHLLVLSTDYVFDGEAGPYREVDPVRPLSVYGQSKLGGERAAAAACPDLCVARTSVLYGVAPGVRPSFVVWLVNELSAGRPVTVVDDQTGSPTLADDLALLLLDLSARRTAGVFHTAGPEWLNRYDFAVRIAAAFALDAGLIRRGATAGLRQPAPRPRHSGLVVAKLIDALGREPAGIDTGLATVRRQIEMEPATERS
jgi:dTDP-4-dehydrorhamnose reductase